MCIIAEPHSESAAVKKQRHRYTSKILTAVYLIASIRAVLVPIAIQRARDAAVVLALELVDPAGDVAAAYLVGFIPAVWAVFVPVANPGLVHASEAVPALKFRRSTGRRHFWFCCATLETKALGIKGLVEQ